MRSSLLNPSLQRQQTNLATSQGLSSIRCNEGLSSRF
jgi:hypothetical protein